MTKLLCITIGVAIVCGCAGHAVAANLFSDNFNLDTSASWTKNAAPAANASTQTAEFAFDYSPYGIPAAPGSVDTLGLRLRADVPIVGGVEVTSKPAGVLSGLSVSPTGLTLPASYQMTFYAWSNFCGAPNAQGLADNGASEGGTYNVMFAVGTAGTVPVVVGNTGLVTNGVMDGIGFATTGDGGITNDYRVYPKSGTYLPGTTTNPDLSNVYAAGNSTTSTQNVNTYYATTVATLGSHMAPSGQQGIADAEYLDPMPTQAGSTQAGSFGFAWHKVAITKNAGTVSWKIDDFDIAKYDASALTLGGNNIALGVSDVNANTTRHPSLVFTVFDNLVISTVAVQGDFNGDTKVDAADYTVWRDNFGAPESAINNNGDGQNGVDQADFLIWKNAFGTGTGSGGIVGAPAPEPSSLLLLVTGAGFYWRGRWRSKTG